MSTFTMHDGTAPPAHSGLCMVMFRNGQICGPEPVAFWRDWWVHDRPSRAVMGSGDDIIAWRPARFDELTVQDSPLRRRRARRRLSPRPI